MLKPFILLGMMGSVATPITAIASRANASYDIISPKSKTHVAGDQLEVVYESERNPKKATIIFDKDANAIPSWKIGDELVVEKSKFMADSDYTARYMGIFKSGDTEKVLINVRHNLINLHWGFLIQNEKVLKQAKNTDPDDKDFLISKLNKGGFYEKIKSYMKLHIVKTTYNATNERPIIFKAENNQYMNFEQKDKIDFLSSWGKENSDGGWGYLKGYVFTDKISSIEKSTDAFLKDKISNQSWKYITQYYNGITHNFYQDLAIVPDSIRSNITSTGLAIIPEYKILNPPVRTLKYKYEGNAFGKTITTNYKNLYLPKGAGDGLQWWKGLITGFNPLSISNIIQSIIHYYTYDTITSKEIKVISEIKDKFSWIKFDKELPLSQLYWGDMDIKLTYRAYANATSLFGDRTEINFSDAMLFTSLKSSRDYFAIDNVLK